MEIAHRSVDKRQVLGHQRLINKVKVLEIHEDREQMREEPAPQPHPRLTKNPAQHLQRHHARRHRPAQSHPPGLPLARHQISNWS